MLITYQLRINVENYEGIGNEASSETESCLHLINVIQFFPSEQLHSHILITLIAGLEMLGDNLRLASHMAVSGGFLINRIAQLQTVFNSFRTKIKDFVNFLELSHHRSCSHDHVHKYLHIY